MSPLLDHPLETTKGQGLRALSFGNQPGVFSFKLSAFGPYFVTALGSVTTPVPGTVLRSAPCRPSRPK